MKSKTINNILSQWLVSETVIGISGTVVFWLLSSMYFSWFLFQSTFLCASIFLVYLGFATVSHTAWLAKLDMDLFDKPKNIFSSIPKRILLNTFIKILLPAAFSFFLISHASVSELSPLFLAFSLLLSFTCALITLLITAWLLQVQ